MITVISGTNRPRSNTAKISALTVACLRRAGEEVKLLDLAELPRELFNGASYGEKPVGFEPFQEAILDTDGILTVIPEYNGAYPGVMKYFVDMLQFPDSLYEKPAAFIGLSAGPWGAVRAVEQLQMVFQYRHAHLFGRRLFLPNVGACLDDAEQINDAALAKRLDDLVKGFVGFCDRLKANSERS